MYILLGFLYLVLGVICMWVAIMIFDDDFLTSKIWRFVLFICAGIFFILATIRFAKEITYFINTPEQYSYPASEYRISIKTTTMNDKTDTTYVITKIK